MEEPSNPHAEATWHVAQSTIRTVADLERDFEQRQLSSADWLGDTVGGFVGSLRFVFFELVLVSAWILLNSGAVPFIAPFDRFPYSLLQLIVGLQALLLLTFVLMRENRLRRLEAQRAELELQVNLLAERKTTEILKLLVEISRELGLEEKVSDEETKHLSKETHLETLAHELEDKLSPGK